jgi:hypothetical protein
LGGEVRYQVHDLFDHAPDYVAHRRHRETERKREKVCENCGAAYHSSERHAKYCSPSCRTMAYRKGREKLTGRDGGLRHRDGQLTHCDGQLTEVDEPPAPAPAPALNKETPLPPFSFDGQNGEICYPAGFDTPKVRTAIARWFSHLAKRGKCPLDPAQQATACLRLFSTPEAFCHSVDFAEAHQYVTLKDYSDRKPKGQPPGPPEEPKRYVG